MIQQFYQRKFPILNVNEDLYLREQNEEDTRAFYEYYSDPNVHQFILATPPSNFTEAKSEIQYCRSLFQQSRGIFWTLAQRDNDRMIGSIGLYINNQHHRAEICYDLAKPYWQKGIMRSAMATVIDFAFNEMDIYRIEAITTLENIASIGILLRLGFIHECKLHNYRYYQNKSYDVDLYALTPAMLNAHQKIKPFKVNVPEKEESVIFAETLESVS